MIRVKICGLTSREDAQFAEELGADALGFIFADSPRRIDPEAARRIIAALPPLVHKVGVFVDPSLDEVLETIEEAGLTVVQLHGQESNEFCQKIPVPVIKSFRVSPDFKTDLIKKYDTAAFLLDTFDPRAAGGTGKTFDWLIAAEAGRLGRLVLSGGLNTENIIEAIDKVRPYAVDVCSGVESSPGVKDRRKLRAFMERVKIYGI